MNTIVYKKHPAYIVKQSLLPIVLAIIGLYFLDRAGYAIAGVCAVWLLCEWIKYKKTCFIFELDRYVLRLRRGKVIGKNDENIELARVVDINKKKGIWEVATGTATFDVIVIRANKEYHKIVSMVQDPVEFENTLREISRAAKSKRGVVQRV